MPMEVHVQVARRNGAAVVQLAGELDVLSAPRARDRLVALLAQGERRLVLDLSGLVFCDSMGAGVLIGLRRRAVEIGGEVVVAHLSPAMQAFFAATGLDRIFRCHATVEDALA